MRAPFELGWSLESSTNTPAFLISSLNFLIAGGSFSISLFPDSQPLLALTIIMNHIFIPPDTFVFNPALPKCSSSVGFSLRGFVLARTKPRRLKPALPRRQPRNFHDGADFHGSPAPCRDPPGDADGLIEVLSVDQEVSAQLFARLRERAVGHHPFVVANADAGRRGGRMERPGSQILPAFAELDRKLRGFPVALRPFGLAQSVLIQVNEQHVFHFRLPICKSNAASPDRHPDHKIHTIGHVCKRERSLSCGRSLSRRLGQDRRHLDSTLGRLRSGRRVCARSIYGCFGPVAKLRH